MTGPGPLLGVAEDCDEDYEALERMLRSAGLSGSRRQEDIDAAYAAGANAYVAKPVDARELDLLLRSLLDWWARILPPSRPPLEGAA